MKTLKVLAFLVAAGLLLLGSCTGSGGSAEKRPNIIFILTDDQSPFTLKAYGNEVCETPSLDRLAAEGMVLDGAYHVGSWSGAVCLPSRTMIQTSINLWKMPDPNKGYPRIKPEEHVHDMEAALAAMPPDHPARNSMPMAFNRAGYTTFRTCKVGNTYEPASRLYQIRQDIPQRYRTEDNNSDWHGERMMEFLRKREETGDRKPFMAFFGFTHPHDPRYGKPELLEKYGAVNELELPAEPNSDAPPLQPNYLPGHPFHHGHPGLRDEERVQGVMLNRDETTIRNELGREYACIENIDRAIGRVLEKLEAMGELDNTYILYTADHGIAVGRHGLTGKQNLYEHTWRVPFIVRGPGIEAGSRANGNTYLMDVLPTICDLAGIEAPDGIDGKSFKPVLMGEKENIREVLYGVYAGGTKPGIRAVKKGKWKLIKYDVLDGQVRETQLFNLEENPNEFLVEHHNPAVIEMTGFTPEAHQVNLAADPAYAEKLEEMEALLLAEMRSWGDPYRLWNQEEN